MPQTIDTAFIRQYESEVHEGFERKGSELRGLARTKTGIVGTSTTFQIIGSGSAVQKTRHGVVPPANLGHTNVTVSLSDWYMAEDVDKLDELKTNIDERGVLTGKIAQGLGRKMDDQIITALEAIDTAITSTAGGMSLQKVREVVTALGSVDALEEGQVYGALPWSAWVEMATWDEFASSEWVEGTWLSRFGKRPRNWFGIYWFPHSALTSKAFVWHKMALGHALGAEISTDAFWDGNRQTWRLTSSMSAGAVGIDANGVYGIQIN